MRTALFKRARHYIVFSCQRPYLFVVCASRWWVSCMVVISLPVFVHGPNLHERAEKVFNSLERYTKCKVHEKAFLNCDKGDIELIKLILSKHTGNY